jgi:hypothetical protein
MELWATAAGTYHKGSPEREDDGLPGVYHEITILYSRYDHSCHGEDSCCFV